MDDILSEGASAAPQRVARHGGRNRGTNEGSVRMAQRAGAGRGVSVSSRSEGAARVQRGRQGQRRMRSFVWAAEAWMWRTAKRRMSIDASSRVGPAGAAAGTYRFWVPLYAQKASTKQADTIWSARRGAIVLPPPPVRVSWASILTDGRQRKRSTGEPRGIILVLQFHTRNSVHIFEHIIKPMIILQEGDVGAVDFPQLKRPVKSPGRHSCMSQQSL